MKYKIILKKSYNEFEFIFECFEEASIFVETALRNGNDISVTIENYIDKENEDGREE